MSRFTVLITVWDIGHRIHDDAVELLQKNDVRVKVNPNSRYFTESELLDEIRGIDGVLATASDPFTREVFAAADRLKVVGRNGVGYDNIDVEAATERGICVTLTPIPEHVRSVADAAFTLILSSLRRIPQLDKIARSGDWSGDKFVTFVHDAYGKRLGIIGLGRIGTEVARRARGFDMEIVYYDIVRKEDLEKNLDVRYLSLEELLTSSDIVSVHIPLTPQTRHMIGNRELATMKKEAFLINTARGAIIDEHALYEALKSGKIRGAGLDVLEEEPPSSDNPLLKLENVVLTPHAAASYEDLRAMSMTVCEDMLRVFRGIRPKYLLNQEVLRTAPLRMQ